MVKKERLLAWVAVAITTAVMVIGSIPVAAVSVALQNGSRTFPETGKTAQGRFLTYWMEHGGLAQQGYPISDEMQEVSETDGKTYTVQYFERAVFELHPENPAPYDVLLSLLGNFLYGQKYPDGAPGQRANDSAGSREFPETGKRLGGIFLEYWQSHGGLAQQGFPISDEFVEVSDLDGKQYTVQYFERAVFERHPENAGTAYEVLLSQLGTFRHREKHGTGTPTPGTQPTQAVPSGNSPAARAGHDLVYHDGLKMVLVANGGDAAGEPEGAPSKLWGWDGRVWKIVSDNGPAVRSLGGVAYDSQRNALVMYGGSTQTTVFNDTWEWDASGWKKREAQGPGFRHHISMMYDSERKQMALYGGNLMAGDSTQSEMTFPTDTWTWDGVSWKQANTSGLGVRYHYAMDYDSARKRTLLFGGTTRAGNRNDLWGWDGAAWNEYKPEGVKPSVRFGARMAFDERAGKMVLFGGLGGREALDDTWTWDGTQWAMVEVAGVRPAARSHHAMAYDKARGRVVLFGGALADGMQLGDTWEWDGVSWAKVYGP